jgi:hypothetical protein
MKHLLFIFAIFVSLVVQADAQNPIRSNSRAVDYPEVPRVSAYEAYVKYKAGKAIIIHAGGEAFERRHIIGAFYVSLDALSKGEIKLPNFPKNGSEIFTYCY